MAVHKLLNHFLFNEKMKFIAFLYGTLVKIIPVYIFVIFLLIVCCVIYANSKPVQLNE